MCKQEKASNKINQETGETAYENSQQCNDQNQLITLKLLDCPALLAEAKGVLLSPVWLLVFLYHIAKAWGLENAVEGPKMMTEFQKLEQQHRKPLSELLPVILKKSSLLTRSWQMIIFA